MHASLIVLTASLGFVLTAPSSDSDYPGYFGFGPYGVGVGVGTYAGGWPGMFYWPFPGAFPSPAPVFPWMQMPKEWTQSDPNMCNKTLQSDNPQEIQNFLQNSGVSFFAVGSTQQRTKDCKGDESRTVCIEIKPGAAAGGKTLYVATVYECCHGFQMSAFNGCVEMDLKNLAPTLRGLKAVKFARLAEKVGFADRLHNDNLTVFCPPDDRLEFTIAKLRERYNGISLPKVSDATVRSLIATHFIKGFLRFDDIIDQTKLQTENPKATIRMDIFYIPHKLVTANCVPITSFNHFARNGLVHLVEKVLPTPTKTVADIVASDPEFSVLKRLLSKAGLVQFLRNPEGNFTLFAPTDAAFELERFYPRNECAAGLMRNHILEHVICSSAITSYAESMNLLGDMLSLSREADNKIYVEDVQVVAKDIIGTNGVVHIIDGLLVPREAKPLTQVLEETKLTAFLDLLKYADLRKVFDMMKNATFFVPSNEAIRKIPRSKLERLLSENETLQEILLFHSAKSQFYFNKMQQEELLASQAGNRNIRIEQYNAFPYHTKQVSVQCARVLSPNNRLCGSVLHVIDRFLLPSEHDVVEILETSPELSTFLHLLREVGLDHRLRESRESFTVLAPINDAFERVHRSLISELRRDIRQANEFLKMHIIPGALCCHRLVQTVMAGHRQTRSLEGSLLRIGAEAALRIGDARIVECDKAGDNGVVHTLDNFVYFFRSSHRPRDFRPWFR